MAEEDLIFGKNRHLFGGMEPAHMKKFEVEAYDGMVRLHCTLPDETVVNTGQTLEATICTVAGAVIRGSETGYPKDEFDGYLVADITTSGCVIDTNATIDGTYYYAAFPYSGQGVYSRNSDNRAVYSKVTNTYLFGYNLILADSNPDTRVEYPPDVMNAGYTPAKMNYTTGVFDYGSWPSEPGDNFMPRPCMLRYDGTVLEYLDPNDYTKQYNSTSSSSVTSSDSDANAMMEWPKIYTHREVVNGVYKFRCSDAKLGDDWDCWCNYDYKNNEIDHFYTGIYAGSFGTDRLRSLSGFNIQSAKDLNNGYPYYNTYCASAESNDSSGNTVNTDMWSVELLSDRALIQDLLVLMAKTTNCTAAYGLGAAARGVATCGTMDKKGLFWGANDTKSGVKVFGMEHWWGNRYRLMNGLVGLYSTATTGHIKYKITVGTHDGSTSNGFTVGGTLPKKAPDYAIHIDGSDITYGTGYIDSMEFISPHGRLYANSFTGSSSTYETDVSTINFAGNNSSTAYMVPYVGVNGTDYGPFCMYFERYSTSSGDLGGYTCASLSCKPHAE